MTISFILALNKFDVKMYPGWMVIDAMFVDCRCGNINFANKEACHKCDLDKNKAHDQSLR